MTIDYEAEMDSAEKLSRQRELWSAVDAAIDESVSVRYDGCHRIYINADQVFTDEDIEHGCDLVELQHADISSRHIAGGAGLSDEERSLLKERVHNWFDESCPLRFVEKVSLETVDGVEGVETFNDLIAQCEEVFLPEDQPDEVDDDLDEE